MNYSEQLYQIVEREFGEVGRFILEKQCKDLNIDPRHIEGKNLPRLSRILSGLMSRFGDDKARRVGMAISNLRIEEIESEETEQVLCPECATPVLAEAERCRRCGTKLSKEEPMPQLFSKGAYGGKTVTGGLNIVDVSKKMAKKQEG